MRWEIYADSDARQTTRAADRDDRNDWGWMGMLGLKSALVGAAATRFKAVLGDVVPGFTEHLAKAEADRSREPTH